MIKDCGVQMLDYEDIKHISKILSRIALVGTIISIVIFLVTNILFLLIIGILISFEPLMSLWIRIILFPDSEYVFISFEDFKLFSKILIWVAIVGTISSIIIFLPSGQYDWMALMIGISIAPFLVAVAFFISWDPFLFYKFFIKEKREESVAIRVEKYRLQKQKRWRK
ncbi:MAG: hypothetical protein JSW00_15755 [Thermoplasmata archaeon]|nr:MAG: hypothetical protein JSW00_15755 [Thermoplasmata archaeon]